jgi:diguanylate cyclase (GGDEF)-like protein/PAS domain S-box-containing protein
LIEILALYGLAFVVLGVAILVLPKQDSAIRFVRHLPLLAAFGLIHGALELVILWKVVHLASGGWLDWGIALLLFASFLPLFEFGRLSLWGDAPAAGLYQGQFAPWLYAMLIVTILAISHIAEDAQAGFVTATRFLLGFPAALLAGFALLGRESFRQGAHPALQSHARLAAGCFFSYALLTLVLPVNDPHLPVLFLTHAQFEDIFGLPVQALRAVCAGGAALALVGFVRRMNQDSRERELEQVRTAEYANALLNQELAQRQKFEEELELLAVAFETQEAVLITDARGRILRVNEAFQRITGYTAEEVTGHSPALLSSGKHDAGFYQTMWRELQTHGKWAGEIWNRRKNGELYPEWLTITSVRDQRYLVGAFSDISTRKQAEEEIRQLALYDTLTKLPNRRLLRDRLTLAFSTSLRNRTHGAVMFFDLDNFKNINDTKGHEVGDLLLVQVAQRLTDSVRDSDTVARVGGDEFVLVLTDLDTSADSAAAQVERVAEKILLMLRAPYDLDGLDYVCSASVGISLFFDHEMGVDELFRRADTAMYRAKAAGKNAFCFFDPEMQSSLESRMRMESDLRVAIANQQLELYFQPQVDTGRRIDGAEVLLRWRHPQHGLVSPAEFIPLAEETGLILPIGSWVLTEACARLRAWEASPLTGGLQLAVNVSSLQFQQPDFVAQVERILHESGANPARLKLELTESALLDDVETCIRKMAELRMLGIAFSLDDFGTGYSSLTYLKRLPITQLKIDQSFVRDIAHDQNEESNVRTIIAMAQSMQLDVIAEGVETEGQFAFLKRSGCSSFQGYLMGRPVPLDDFERRLEAD